MYKDRLQKFEEPKFVSLEDVDQYKDPNDQAPPPQTPQTLSLRRSSRISKPPERYSPALYHILYTDGSEPECFDEAMQGDTQIKWEHAMKEEMDSLLKNQTWSLVELLEGKKALTNKWVYRIKEEGDG